MPVSIDERVVSMRFDNNQFLNGVTQTIQAVAALKTALNFSGVAQGLQEVGDSLKDWSMDTLGNSVDSVAVKFRFLDTLAMNFFNRLSDQILNSATNMAKMVTGIEGAAEGFSKYGEKTRAVQTILTAVKDKGYELQDVNDVLEDMNWFTDETSYNFTEMTNTIGKFTSSGVDLLDAKDAVQGIALWAAESGQNASTASRAMYQLSQAYGTGVIRLQDWMSIEQANMSTAKIQNELIKEGGKEAEAAVKKFGGFRASLQSGWLTTEKFTTVMKKYSEGISEANWENGKFTGGVTELSKSAFLAAQEARTWTDTIDALKDAISTGWMHTWEYIFGNKDEASEFFTGVANGLIEVSDYFTEIRNSAIEAWYDLGGRSALVDSIFSTWDTLGSVFGTVAEAIGDILHPAQTLQEKMENLLGLSEDGDKIISDIEKVQTLMSNGLIPEDVGTDQIKALEEELDRLDNASGLLKITNNIKNFAEEFRKAFDPGEGSDYYAEKISGLNKQLEAIQSANSNLLTGNAYQYKLFADSMANELKTEESISAYVKKFRENNEQFWHDEELAKLTDAQIIENRRKQIKEAEGQYERALELEKQIKDIRDEIAETEEKRADAQVAEYNLGEVESFARGIGAIVKTVGDAVSGFTRAIVPLFGPVKTIAVSLFDMFGALGEFIVKLTGASKEGNMFYNVFQRIVEIILPAFTNACEFIAGYIDLVTENIDGLYEKIESGEGIFKYLEDVKRMLGSFFDLIENLFTQLGSGQVSLITITGAFETFFKSLIANAGPAATVLKTIWDTLTGFFNSVVNTFTKKNDMVEGGKQILSLAEILERAGALIGQVAGGLVSGIQKIFEGIGKAISGFSLVKIWRTIKGIAAVEGVLSIAGFINELKGVAEQVKNIFQMITGMFNRDSIANVVMIFQEIGKAFIAIAAALFIISLIPTEKMGATVTTLTFVIGELVAAFGLMALMSTKIGNGNGQQFDKIGDTFLSLAAALLVISFAVNLLGHLSVEELIKGLTATGLILAALAVVGSMMSSEYESSNKGSGLKGLIQFGKEEKGKEMMKGAGGFVLLAVAIRIIAGAVKMLGKLDQNQIEQGLLGFVVILGSLTAVSVALQKFGVGGLKMAGIALSMQMIGIALLEIAGVIAILGYMDVNKANQGLGNFITTLAALTASLILLSKFASGLKLIGIATGMILLGTAMGIFAAEIAILGNIGIEKVMIGLFAIAGALTILGVAGAVMLPVIPTLILLAGVIAIMSVGVLAAGVGIAALAGAFALLGATMQKYGTTIGTAVFSIVSSIAMAIPLLAAGLVNGIKIFITGIANSAVDIVQGFVAIGSAILDGFVSLLPKVSMTITMLITTIVMTITTCVPMLAEGGAQLLLGLLHGIELHIGDIVTTVGMIIVNFLTALSSMLPLIINAGIELAISFIEGVAYGIANNSERVVNAFHALVDSLKVFLLTVFYDMTKDIPVIGDKIGETLEKVKSQMASTQIKEEVADSFAGIPTSVAEKIRENSENGELEGSGQNMLDKIKIGLLSEEGLASITSGGTGVVQTLTEAFNTSESTELLNGSATTLVGAFTTGLTSIENTDSIKQAGGNLAQEGSDGASEKEDEFIDTGKNLGYGIGTGLQDSAVIQSVCEAAANLVKEAVTAANEAGGIESPSKETKKTGKFLVLGAVEGIKEFANVLYDAASDLGSNTVSSIGTAMNSIYDATNSIDTVSIRPVLDLTEATKEANDLSSMLDGNSIKEFAQASISVDNQGTRIDKLVDVTTRILGSIQNGSDLYLDDSILAGRINRRLGAV